MIFYFTKYNFEVNQNVSAVNDQLKNRIIGKLEFQSNNIFGLNTPYFGQFNYDEFVLSRCIRPLERFGIWPDAHITLQNLNNEKTSICVKIKLSEIWNLALVFIHLGIISIGIFTSNIYFFKHNIEVNWMNRVLIIAMTLIILNLIVWISFKIQTQKFKGIINKIFFS